MSKDPTATLLSGLLEVESGTIVNLAVPAHYFSQNDMGLATVKLERAVFAPSLYFEKDPERRFNLSTPLPEIAEKLAAKKEKIAVVVTGKRFLKVGEALHAWQSNANYYANSERAATMLGVFLSAIGELDGYDVVLGLGYEGWNDERADELERHGLHVVYDDTKKLKRYSKKLHSPNNTKVTLYHRDQLSGGVVRLLSPSTHSEALQKHYEGMVAAKAFYKAIRYSGFKLPNKYPENDVIARLVKEMTLDTVELELAPQPEYLDKLEAWSVRGALNFIQFDSTLFSKAKKWSGTDWYTRVYPVFCAMLPLWGGVLVAKTRSGNPKKSNVNKELSKVLNGMYPLDSEEADRTFEMMRKAAGDTGLPKMAEALKLGVPVSDVVA